MADRAEKASTLLNRRDFLTKASVAMAAAATLTVMSRNFSPFRKAQGDASSAGSMFTPRPGSRLKYWGSRLSRFRLR